MQDNLPGWYHEDFARFVPRQDEGSHLLYQLVYWPVPDLRRDHPPPREDDIGRFPAFH